MPYDKITTNFSPSQSYQTLMVPTTTQNQTAQNIALYMLGANLKQAKRISTNDAYSSSSCSINVDYVSQTTGIYNNNINSGVIAIFLGSSTGDFVEGAMTVQFYTTNSNGNPEKQGKGSLADITYINEYQCSVSFPGTIDNYDNGIKPGYFIVTKYINNGLQNCSAKINITYGNVNNKNVPQFWGYFPYSYGVDPPIQSIAATSVSIPRYASYVNPSQTGSGNMIPGYINFYNTDEFSISFKIYMNKNNYALLNGNLTGVLFRWSNKNHEYKYYFYESGFVQPPDKDSDGHTFITAKCVFNSNNNNGVDSLSGQDFIIMPFSTVGSCPENAVFFTIYN